MTDLRNSKVADLVTELARYGVEVCVHDPEANAEEAAEALGIRLWDWEELPQADAVVAAVAHRRFLSMGVPALAEKLTPGGCFIDVKARFDRAGLEAAGYHVWRL